MSTLAQSSVVVDPGALTSNFIGALNIPGPVKTVLYFVETGFWIGRKIRNWFFVVENPDLTLFGAFLNEQIGTNSFVRVVAQVVQLARIITELGMKAENFVRSMWRIRDACAVASIELSYSEAEFSAKSWYVRVDLPSTSTLPWPIAYARAKTQLIFNRVVAMLYAAYEVSYTLFELREAISRNLGESSVNELPMEIQRLVDSFSGRESELGKAIVEHEQAIDRIFATAMLPWSTRRLAETLESLSTGGRVAKSVAQIPGVIVDSVQKVIPKDKPW